MSCLPPTIFRLAGSRPCPAVRITASRIWRILLPRVWLPCVADRRSGKRRIVGAGSFLPSELTVSHAVDFSQWSPTLTSVGEGLVFNLGACVDSSYINTRCDNYHATNIGAKFDSITLDTTAGSSTQNPILPSGALWDFVARATSVSVAGRSTVLRWQLLSNWSSRHGSAPWRPDHRFIPAGRRRVYAPAGFGLSRGSMWRQRSETNGTAAIAKCIVRCITIRSRRLNLEKYRSQNRLCASCADHRRTQGSGLPPDRLTGTAAVALLPVREWRNEPRWREWRREPSSDALTQPPGDALTEGLAD